MFLLIFIGTDLLNIIKRCYDYFRQFSMSESCSKADIEEVFNPKDGVI